MKQITRMLLIFLIGIMLTGCGSETTPDTRIHMPASSNDFEGSNYEEVIETLENAGFINVQTEVLDDLVTGWLTKDGEVEEVSVEGDTVFSTDSKYDADVEIVVTYHTFSVDTEESSEENVEECTDVIETESSETTDETESSPEIPAETETSQEETDTQSPEQTATASTGFKLSDIPAYSGSPYVSVNNNVPYFEDTDMTATSYEYYSPLDASGRCGVCVASIGLDLMPTEERGEIGSVKPTGWHTVKYNGIIDGNYLYNRCHLIGFQLSGENANTSNLITGTRYLNIEGMLPYENMVADYVKETGNHVMYRVTPVFDGSNLVASGVLMEGKSVEDNGDGILFNVFCYNVQPGIAIDYASGNSQTDGTIAPEETNNEPSVQPTPEPTPEPEAPAETGGSFAVNANNGKIHMVGACSATGSGDNAMKNPVYFNTYEEAEAYSISIAPSQDKRKCGNCW